MTIRVLVCNQARPIAVAEIEQGLEGSQAVVGGYIETVSLAPDADLVCNEDGIALGLPLNRVLMMDNWIEPVAIYGNFFICGIQDGEFVSLTDEQIADWRSFVGSAILPEDIHRYVTQARQDNNAGRPLEQCLLCGSTAMQLTDFKDEISRRESRITRTCQHCQDNLFKEEPE